MKNQNEHTLNRRRNQRVLSLALALVLSGLLVSLAAAQSQATMRLVPLMSKVEQGQTVAVILRVEDVQGLYGAQVDLHFDPTRLAVHDADPAAEGIQSTLGSFLSPDFVVLNEVDNEKGILRLAFTQMAPNPPAEGAGDLATVTFKGLGSGKATLKWEKVILANGDGQEIETRLEGATIQVGTEFPIVELLVGSGGILGIGGALLIVRQRMADQQS